MAERFADGLARKRELQLAGAEAFAALHETCRARTGEKDLTLMNWRAPPLTFRRSAPAAVRWACLAAWTTVEEAEYAAMTAESVANTKDLLADCDLLREMIGNPFRPFHLNCASVTPGVADLAKAAYAERILPSGELDRARLAVLADALEEAGCTDPSILEHLRGPGPHVRGCSVIDLVLAKE